MFIWEIYQAEYHGPTPTLLSRSFTGFLLLISFSFFFELFSGLSCCAIFSSFTFLLILFEFYSFKGVLVFLVSMIVTFFYDFCFCSSYFFADPFCFPCSDFVSSFKFFTFKSFFLEISPGATFSLTEVYLVGFSLPAAEVSCFWF